jgi:hypothetical protein
LFNRARTGERGRFDRASPQKKPLITIDYAKAPHARIKQDNRSVTGGDFALIRAITGAALAMIGKSDSGPRKRAGGFEDGFAGALAGARKGPAKE